PGFLGFADKDLVERLQGDVRLGILLHEDIDQLDVKHLRLNAVGDARADDEDLVRGGPRRDAARALQQVEDGFRAAVRHGALQTGTFAEEIDFLAVEFGDANLDGRDRDPGRGDHARGDLSDRLAFDTQTAKAAQVEPAVRSDGLRAGQVRNARDVDF